MASASTSTHLHIIDEDDDEFDWESAVKEIDNAYFQPKSAAATEKSTYNSCNDHFSKTENQNQNKKFSSAKQSTLDKFIGSASSSISLNSRPDNLIYKNSLKNVVNSNDNNDGAFSEDKPSCVQIDAEAAKTWIYPVHGEMRDYQLNITQTALFSNTLVVLPTGLGKTLIAAVVMYNYFRWFPQGKIVFAAPSRPLVMQQIEACHNIVGIPQEWTIDLTGQTNPTKRAGLWKDKRVFFVTPQVLEKDISSGSCLVKNLVCLVIDEAHRATGNYAYCVAVRQLMAASVQLRILALSATPGSKQQTIQDVINNLNISTLEHRSETDHDVSQYVHDRKVELAQVSMGKDADQINDLLCEVIRPCVNRLSSIGVLPKRDPLTLSPCDLLNSRERFRQAPPENLPQVKYSEVETYFGALITLYHIRKLLSSHGIKPAYEMLADKLIQGPFARLMCRNEVLIRAKILMQQNVEHGAPSPKLSKMLEILIDHFKKSDSQNSRVIIFSNFRGSVRDIMSALLNIGDLVKATEFIGQSSGKTLKGQTQKVQQAVLENFRSGKYNVIVATSIGEEGLDIMEVDLVICFDANVSPLRMIQRMGRTGRKHQGRVVVLACEGSELKGYLGKKSKGKAIQKHMRNGGLNSFTFHSSPRMIPHVFKPEVKFEELSIAQFVHRGKKVRGEDQDIQDSTSIPNLTESETKLIAKYFNSTEEKFAWRPSLIAFPLFQSYPSRIHHVKHSSRTGMLIDTMQCLQESSYSMESKAFQSVDEVTLDPCVNVEAVEINDNFIEGSHGSLGEACEVDVEFACEEASNININTPKEIPILHKFLFGSKCISIDNLGMVEILTVPELPSLEKTGNLNQFSTTHLNIEEFENIISTPSPVKKYKEINEIPESPVVEEETNIDFSPRLTNFIKSGYVPESPTNETSSKCVEESNLSQKMHTHLLGDEIKGPLSEDFSFVPNEVETPLGSKEWKLSSGEKSQQKCRFKRLRKHGDFLNNNATEINGEYNHISKKSLANNNRGVKKRGKDAVVFIEEEAEVSNGDVVSNDEEDEKGCDSYDDSFIDDRINPTAANTQIDMIALYRRSLFTQPDFSPESVAKRTITNQSATTSGTEDLVSSTNLENRKRKMSLYEEGSLPVNNLDKEFLSVVENEEEDDDRFFQSIDLDALEEQAAKQFKYKSECALQNNVITNSEAIRIDLGVMGSPSFDLGI